MSTASPVDAVTVHVEVRSAVALLLRCVFVPSKRTATIPFAVVAARAVYYVDWVASSAGACVKKAVVRAARLVLATTTGIEEALHAAYPVGGGKGWVEAAWTRKLDAIGLHSRAARRVCLSGTCSTSKV